MSGINEKEMEDYPKPIFMECTEIILEQMKKTIGKICLDDGTKGTGFFCKIPLNNNQDSLTVFITNNHIINEDFLKNEKKEIIIKMNNEKIVKNIKLKQRFYYTNKDYDVTIIEIKKNIDNINDFLELDDNILIDSGAGYIKNSIYLLHYPSYPNGQKAAVSFGIVKKRFEDKQYNFIHYCNTEYGSSGSPILCLSNNKVIGIHKQRGNENQNFNIGAFLHGIILEYINKYKLKDVNNSMFNNTEQNKNDVDDEITIKYRNDYGLCNIKLFGYKFVEENKNLSKIIYKGKEVKLCAFLIDEMDCYDKIIEIKLKGIKNLISVNFMFYGCTQLLSLPDLSKIDFNKYNGISHIFCGCLSLTDLCDISKFKSKFKYGWNFFCCSSLIDLKGFDIYDFADSSLTDHYGAKFIKFFRSI